MFIRNYQFFPPLFYIKLITMFPVKIPHCQKLRLLFYAVDYVLIIKITELVFTIPKLIMYWHITI